jgi:hypothetical protein
MGIGCDAIEFYPDVGGECCGGFPVGNKTYGLFDDVMITFTAGTITGDEITKKRVLQSDTRLRTQFMKMMPPRETLVTRNGRPLIMDKAKIELEHEKKRVSRRSLKNNVHNVM